MNTFKKFRFRNIFKDQYVVGFVPNGRLKIGDAYYKIIYKIFNPIVIYLLGLFTPEIKNFIISLFK